VRRGMKAMDEAASGEWMKKPLKSSYEPLLQEPWVLDVDTTVKPLYGHQQDAKVGYNPTKPGGPSHGATMAGERGHAAVERLEQGAAGGGAAAAIEEQTGSGSGNWGQEEV